MQSEIAVEKCHPTLSVMEWWGQEKYGSSLPSPTKGLLLFIFLHPQAGQRLRPLHIKLIKGWLLSEMSLSGKAEEEADQRQLPRLLKFLCKQFTSHWQRLVTRSHSVYLCGGGCTGCGASHDPFPMLFASEVSWTLFFFF